MSKRVDRLIERRIEAQLQSRAARVFSIAAQTLILSMRRRVARGVGADDLPMDAYTPAYERVKGRSGPRDLLVTGRMLGSIVSRRVPRGAWIYFSDVHSERKARGNQRYARWWGVSPTDRQHVIAAARRALRNHR